MRYLEVLHSCRNAATQIFPRRFLIWSAILVTAAIGLIVNHEVAEYLKNHRHELIPARYELVPNMRHVWFAEDLLFDRQRGHQVLLGFGSDYLDTEGNWSKLCLRDSNGDGITNGYHLGDPCCRFSQSQPEQFSVKNHHEYRRWHITHPSEGRRRGVPHWGLEADKANQREHLEMLRDLPVDCGSYDEDAYQEQFNHFYFNKADGEYEGTPVNIAAIACLIFMVGLAVDWMLHKDLLADLCPYPGSQGCSWRVSLTVNALAFVYMDLTSGIVHLILDYAPFYLPGLGVLAQGFQFHHEDPTAIIRISWYAYASHIHLLVPTIYLNVILSQASHMQRLFWFWGGFWAHMFQTAHRWAHFPPEQLSSLVLTLQSAGLLLSHERHMYHHQDLESQFSILSGHADIVLDRLSSVVPAARYDLWFLFGVGWFLLPCFVDILFRERMQSLREHRSDDIELDLISSADKHL